METLFEWFVSALRGNPELALFLAIGIGFWIGSFKFGSFSLGGVTGSLLAALLVGQLKVDVPGLVKTVLFMLFLFGTGYSVGPQFFRSLKGDGLRALAFTVVHCGAGLGVAYAMARLLGLDLGMSAGLLSGGLTQSAAIGTASEAIMSLPLPEAERQMLASHIAVADALTYLFGVVGPIWFLTSFAPRLMGIDLKTEAAALESKLGIKRAAPNVISAYQKFVFRAQRVESDDFIGKRASEMEVFRPEGRMFIERLRRGDRIIPIQPDTIIARGDILVLYGRKEVVLEFGPRIGPEVDDPELLDFPIQVARVIVTNSKITGRTFSELASWPPSRGVGVRKVTRGGEDIPISPATVLDRGDVIELIGPQPTVERVAHEVGQLEMLTANTNLMLVGIGIVLGAFIGIPYFMLGSLKLSMTTSVGVLLAGLVFGWLHSVKPTFAKIPDAAVNLMTQLGLAGFVAAVGLHAGPIFIDAVRDAGPRLLLGGVVVTLLPMLVAFGFGRYFLRMHPILLIGAIAGGQTLTPALAAVQDKADSQTPVLGYTVPYALANILLTMWGGFMVVLRSQFG
jgi:putative transport protein